MECLRCHVVPKPIMRQDCKQALTRKGRPPSKIILFMLQQVGILIRMASCRKEFQGWSLDIRAPIRLFHVPSLLPYEHCEERSARLTCPTQACLEGQRSSSPSLVLLHQGVRCLVQSLGDE
jgi:hypothetical protein